MRRPWSVAGRSPVLAGVVAAVLVLTGFGPPDPDGFSDAELEESITVLARNVTDLAKASRDGRDAVVTLDTDILFAFGSATLSPRAEARIARLVARVPRGVRLSVGGHTDAIGTAASNRRLSLVRARAVAAAITKARPDLKPVVRGYGESRPVAPNTTGGQDDPEGWAKNRRVELRYRG